MQMKVIKAFGPQDLRVVTAPIPTPGPGQVRIKVKASGICGSDKWVWDVPGPTNNVAGHEVAGEIDALGEGVTQFTPGDRVMVNNVGGCGHCPACQKGAFVLCPTWDGHLDINNGFGEYVIAHARNCMQLLPELDFIDGALIMDNWGTPYGGLVRANITPGQTVVITGLGPIGQAAVCLARAKGVQVIAVDPVPWRQEFALKNGAHHAFAPSQLPQAVKDLTQQLGADVLMECSGNGQAYDTGFASLKNEGALIAIGEHAQFNFTPSDHVIRRALKIIGSWYSTMPQGKEIMDLAVTGKIQLKSFLTHTITLEEVPQIFGPVMDCAQGIMKVVIVFN